MGCGASRAQRPADGLEADRPARALAPVSQQRQLGAAPKAVPAAELEETESERTDSAESPPRAAAEPEPVLPPVERPLPQPSRLIDVGEVCEAGGCGCGGEVNEVDAAAWLAGLPADVRASEEAWQGRLSEDQFRVLRMKARPARAHGALQAPRPGLA